MGMVQNGDAALPTITADASVPRVDPRLIRRRGRPYKLPSDPTPMQSFTPGLKERVAWLMGLSRLHAADPRMSGRTAFLAALRELDVTADTTRLSRWESGKTSAPSRVLRAYEDALSLESGRLVIGVTALLHPAEPLRDRHFRIDTDPATAHSRLDDLFERVVSGRTHGHVWLELCLILTRVEHLYLLPSTWAETADLLAGELGRSTGLAYLGRYEALRLLVAHPASRRHAIKAIGSLVTNPATEFVIHPLALLQEVDDPQASELLMRLLGETPGLLRSGASWAVAGAVAHHSVDDDMLTKFEAITVEMLHRSQKQLHRLDPLNIYASLPSPSQERLGRAGFDAASRNALDLAAQHRELRRPDQARRTASALAAAVQERAITTRIIETDQMLHRLVREALFHVHHHRRHQAALLLSVSPYRSEVATQLVKLAKRDDETTSVLALTALFLIAEEKHRAEIWRIAVRDARIAVRVTALMTLSQIVVELGEHEASLLCDELTTPGPLAHAALQVLGMAGAPELDRLSAHSEAQEQAIAWWRGRPAIVERGAPG